MATCGAETRGNFEPFNRSAVEVGSYIRARRSTELTRPILEQDPPTLRAEGRELVHSPRDCLFVGPYPYISPITLAVRARCLTKRFG